MSGVTPFGIERVKEMFTIGASFCNVKAAPMELKKADEIIRKNQKKLQADATLSKLQAILASSLTEDTLKEIDRLKTVSAEKKMALEALKKEIADLKREEEDLCQKMQYAKATELSPLVQKMDALQRKLKAKREKIARIEVWSQYPTLTQLEPLREVVNYKYKKSQVRLANAEREKLKIISGRRYDISKIVVLSFHNLLKLGVALFVAPLFGLSVATVTALFSSVAGPPACLQAY